MGEGICNFNFFHFCYSSDLSWSFDSQSHEIAPITHKAEKQSLQPANTEMNSSNFSAMLEQCRGKIREKILAPKS
jgi:hypothetical protein